MLTLTDAQKEFFRTPGPRRVTTRLEVYDRSSGELLATYDRSTTSGVRLRGGQVTADAQADVLRTASVELLDPNGEVSVGVNGIVGLDKRYKLWRGYYISDAWVWWPLGVFELSGAPEVAEESGARLIRMQLADKSSSANGRPRGGLRNSLQVSQGVSKLAAIQAIAAIETWGETEFNLWADSTATVPYDLSWPNDRTPWEAAQQVNDIPEPDGTITRLFYDPYGRLTLIADPGPDIDTLPAVWTARVTGDDSLSQLVSAAKQMQLFELANAVRVRWGSQLITPGEYLAYDNDSNSPTYVGKIGWFIREWMGGRQDELIQNETEGQARAEYELQRLLAFQESVPFSILENPALEPWDVIELYHPRVSINGKYQLLRFTINLDTNVQMDCEGWRVRKIG